MGHPRRGYVLIAVLAALTLAGALAATHAVASRRATQGLRAEVDRARAQAIARGGAVQGAKMVAIAMGNNIGTLNVKGAKRTATGGIQIGDLPAFPPEMANAGGLLGAIAQKVQEVERRKAEAQGRNVDARPGAGDATPDVIDESKTGDPNAPPALPPPPALDLAPLTLTLAGEKVEIFLECETGKLDINSTPRQTLLELLGALGQSGPEAEALLGAIESFKIGLAPAGSPDRALERVAFRQRPLRGVPLARLEMLLSVPGMEPELFERLVPHLGVSGAGGVDPNYCTPEVWRALGVRDERAIQRIDEARRRTARLDRESLANAIGPTVLAAIEGQIVYNPPAVFTIRAVARSGTAVGRHLVRIAPGDIESSAPKVVESREGWL